jgi:uncharacterized protein (TIGR02594 family)
LLRALFIVLVVIWPGSSWARGFPPPPPAPASSGDDGRAVRGAANLVAIAESHLGQGNFIGLAGPWCADFVSAILRAAGRKPLANRMAASALVYGPHELAGNPGDLVVMRTSRGRYGHVGFVVADRGDTVEIVSGNWGHRVARGKIARRDVTAFVRV